MFIRLSGGTKPPGTFSGFNAISCLALLISKGGMKGPGLGKFEKSSKSNSSRVKLSAISSSSEGRLYLGLKSFSGLLGSKCGGGGTGSKSLKSSKSSSSKVKSSAISSSSEGTGIEGLAGGGSVLQGGGYLEGDSDGQADLVKGNIDGVQEARLSHGEFVLPADVVAMLGNGNSDAGADALQDFMKSVRTKATGNPKQQKNIDADKVLAMLSKRAKA